MKPRPGHARVWIKQENGLYHIDHWEFENSARNGWVGYSENAGGPYKTISELKKVEHKTFGDAGFPFVIFRMLRNAK